MFVFSQTVPLLFRFLKATTKEKENFDKTGYFVSESDLKNYSVDSVKYSKSCIDDAKENLLLTSPIKLDCPVRILHGMNDDVVPYGVSINVAEQLTSKDVHIHLVKNADHRFSNDDNLDLISKILDELTCKE